MSESTELVELDTPIAGSDVQRAISAFSTNSGIYSTFKGSGFSDRKQIVDAITNAEPISDYLNTPIKLANFVIQEVTINDQGEAREAPRVILVDESGQAYYGISFGLLSALRTITGVLGEPSSWPEPVTVLPVEEKTRAGYRVTTLKLS